MFNSVMKHYTIYMENVEFRRKLWNLAESNRVHIISRHITFGQASDNSAL